MNGSASPKKENKSAATGGKQSAIVKRVTFDDPKGEYSEQNQKISTYQPSKKPLF